MATSTLLAPLVLPAGEEERIIQESKELLRSLPKEERGQVEAVYQYKGIWYTPKILPGMLVCQKYFKARDTDVVLATLPKSGTTWLKALAFSITNQARYPPHAHNHPLLSHNPHELVPFLELNLYVDNRLSHLYAAAAAAQSPGLLSTHLTHSALPQSVKDSNCKILYLCRNPRDVLVSRWYFVSGLMEMDKAKSSSISLEDAFEMFCAGVTVFGPYWEHLLEYWKASLENPHKVLFLKYEDLKKEPVSQLKRLADFLGYPFTLKEEEEDRVIQDILQLCSFESLSKLEVNKAGEINIGKLLVERKLFFRRGEVGDSANHLTPQMIQHIDRIIEKKFEGSGLTFQVSA